MPKINIITPVKFECQKGCSNCCKTGGGFVFISSKNVDRISKYLKISKEIFIKKYAKPKGEQFILMDKNGSECIFLENDRCSIYPVRPLQCRTFPFWTANMKSDKRWQQVAEECPGIGIGKDFSKEDIEEVLKGKSVDSQK